MSEVSISKGRLMAMQVGIALLLILAIVFFLKLREEPKIPPDFAEFQRILAEKPSTVAAIFDSTGKVTAFDRNLSLLKTCGESQDRTFPVSCRPKEGSNLLFKNVVTLMVYGKEKDPATDFIDFIVGTEGPTYITSPQRCPDGTCCRPYC